MSRSSASTSDGWRLLLDKPASGAWNMAVDEVLLDGVATGTAPPTLRFYEWTPPCLSLGYFQPFDVVDIAGCRAPPGRQHRDRASPGHADGVSAPDRWRGLAGPRGGGGWPCGAGRDRSGPDLLRDRRGLRRGVWRRSG